MPWPGNNINTSSLGSLGSVQIAMVGPINVAYWRFGPLGSSRDVEPPLVGLVPTAPLSCALCPDIEEAMSHRFFA